MKFIDEIEKLQQKNNGYIVLVKNGIFFTGIGKDAIILNKLLGLQLTCMKENLCKVGFSAISIEKYLGLLALTKKSFVIYDSKKKNGIYEFEQIYRVTTEKINYIMEQIYELGKLIGGLLKFYAKNDTK